MCFQNFQESPLNLKHVIRLKKRGSPRKSLSPHKISTKRKTQKKHTTAGIRWWSPTQLLICRSEACVWQSGRDAQFSSVYGRMCKLFPKTVIYAQENKNPGPSAQFSVYSAAEIDSYIKRLVFGLLHSVLSLVITQRRIDAQAG